MVFFFFTIPPINSIITTIASKVLSSKYSSEISISHVYFNPFTFSVWLKEVKVMDQNSDTLLYIRRFFVDVDKLDFDNMNFELKTIRLENATVNLIQDSTEKFNFDFFIPQDSTEVSVLEEDTLTTKYTCFCSNIEFKQIDFFLSLNSPKETTNYLMDYNHLKFNDINLFANDFSINQDLEIKTVLQHLETKEKCGLEVKNLSANIDFSPHGIRLEHFNLETPETIFNASNTNLIFNGFDDFSSALSNVGIGIEILENSIVGFNDIGHFVKELYSTDIQTDISGLISGKIGNLDIKRLRLSFLDSTSFNLKATLKGLPDIDNFSFKVDTAVLATTSKNIRQLHNPIDKNIPLFEIPDFLDDFSQVKLCAKSLGTLKNLSLSAVLKTKIGNIKTKITLKDEKKTTDIFGFVDASELDLEKFAGKSSSLGILSARFDTLNVKIFPSGAVKGVAKGGVDSIFYNGYCYKGIKINGDFTENLFSGKISSLDKNVKFDFLGKADISNNMNFDFLLNVDNLDLNALNFLTDSIDKMKFSLAANFTGNSVDNFNGAIALTEPFEFCRNSDTLLLNYFVIKSYIDHYRNNLPIRNLKISSDFFDSELKGLVKTEQMLNIANNFVYMAFPSLKNSSDTVSVPKKRKRYSFLDSEFQNNYDNIFEFEFTTGNTQQLTDFFYPELYITPGTHLGLSVNVRRARTYLVLESDSVVFGDYSAENLVLRASARHDTLDLGVDFNKFKLLDQDLETPHLGFSAKHDTALITLSWMDEKEKFSLIKGDFFMLKRTFSEEFPILKFAFSNSEFSLFDTDFRILPSSIIMDTTSYTIDNFRVAVVNEKTFNDDYDFSICGTISEDPKDKLEVKISDFDIGVLENFVQNLNLQGIFNGTFSISNIYALNAGGMPVVELNAESDKLTVEGIDFKNFRAKADLNEADSIINLDICTLKRKTDTLKSIAAYGFYDFKSENADFRLDINDVQLNYFKSFFENYLQTTKYSLLKGRARVWGKLDNPNVNAALTLHGGYFKIQYLGTQYDLNDSMAITIDNKMIKLSKTKFYSGKGTGLAYLDGLLTHNNFSNFNMEVNLSCKNFMVLNSKETDSSAFWGKAYTTGVIKITGDPTRMINIDAKVKTDKNTQVFLPLYMASEVATDWNFITFSSTNQDTEIHRQKADLSDIRMNFNLEVTPEAEVQVLLDESAANNLKVSAKGNLRLNVSGSGDFNMYGALSIVKGDYLFTMQHMLSKKFDITSGSTLRWNGDPMDAIVDLSASYRLRKVSLYNLMVEEEYRHKKVPVRCFLNMKGDLMQPKLSFNVQVEDNSDVVQGQLDNLDEGNINKQAMSLLLLNQFQPLPGLKGGENSMFSDINPGELVSNQLNHWLSDISDKFDVGVNYQMGDGNTSSEFDIAVSTQLLDDRVNVSTNFGVGGVSNNQATQRTNNVVGEVEVDVKLNKTGGIQLKVYNKANDDELDQAPYAQGVGVIFKREFNRINLFSRKKKAKEK